MNDRLIASGYNRAGNHPVDPWLLGYADEWFRAASREVDHVKKAVAVAAHAECLRRIRAQRTGRAEPAR